MLFKYTDADGYDYGRAAAADDDRRGAVDRVYHEFHHRWPQDLCHGGNRESASRVGFSVLRLQLFVYGYMGLMSGPQVSCRRGQ